MLLTMELKVLGQFYGMPDGRVMEEIRDPSDSSLLYAALEDLDHKSNSANFTDLLYFPVFYA